MLNSPSFAGAKSWFQRLWGGGNGPFGVKSTFGPAHAHEVEQLNNFYLTYETSVSEVVSEVVGRT